MKQQGKEWITPEGTQTSAKYLPDYVRHSERLGSRIADLMVGIEAFLEKSKATVNELCMEMLRRYQAQNPDQKDVKRFSFFTFDREFKIEVDVEKNYIRCYQATKQNPKHNEYELINTDFNRSTLNPLASDRDQFAVLPTPIDPQKKFEDIESAVKSGDPELDFEDEESISENVQ